MRRACLIVCPFLNDPCVCDLFGKWDSEVKVATGTIKKVVSDRGFGFVTADDEKDYFFHRNSLEPSLDFDRLVGGERVEFEIESSPKGPRAGRVRSA